MSPFLMLLRGGEFEKYSPSEMEDIVKQYMNWTRELKSQEILIASEELKPDGRMLRTKDGQFVDGPYTETKEAIGGFYLVKAKDYNEATEIAKRCPHLNFNGTIELREVNPHDV